MMKKSWLLWLLGWAPGLVNPLPAQRNYASGSVLSSGNWIRLSVNSPGVYKIDIPFLNKAGVNTTNLASASIRLYGNGGAMLPEANNGSWQDDLQENAIQVSDGGDGLFNGQDYLLFYANGPDEWINDSLNQVFSHRKNIYSDKSYYFLTIGGTGLRVADAPLLNSPNITVTQFTDRYFHELDTVNFLGSGKEWYGEEMSSLPGRSLTRSFSVSFPDPSSGASLVFRSQCIARSINSNSRFDIRVNNQPAGQIMINPAGGGQYDLFAQSNQVSFNIPGAQATNNISFIYFPGGVNAQGWLNWFELFTRRNISLGNNAQLLFRDWNSTGNNRAEFVVAGSGSSTQVWEISDPLHPRKMQGSLNGTDYRFVNEALKLREYVAFNPAGLPAPQAEGNTAVQNLHNTSPADLLIITHQSLLAEATRLADYHRTKDGLKAAVATTNQVFNEFGSGSPDPVAIRDYVKMYYDRYRNSPDSLKYLLLFGDASFDYKERLSGNTNLVPAWQSPSSLDPLGTYTSDDFFGFLDDQEDINSASVSNLLDIGVGRVPAGSLAQARNFVDKLLIYRAPESFGPWRNNLCFAADDEDVNLHFQDAEIITATAAVTGPVFNIRKIYLDAYRQETNAGGSSYPLANQASNNQVINGTLIWNYNGHGGAKRLAEETLLDQEMVNNWNNRYRLPLFITATCDFAPYDNPTISSLGEDLLLRPASGGIALMTTTRPVFAFSNRVMNNNYIRFALAELPDGSFRTLGNSIREAKNFTYQTLGDIINNRKFTLLGDPALRLAFPEQKVRITRVNGHDIAQADTLSAAEKVTIEGEVTDRQGNLLNNFNGTVYPLVLDKPQTSNTLANDPGSQVASFSQQQVVLFKGESEVNGGHFSFSFRVPKDINYQFGPGKISLYAGDGSRDAGGYFPGIIIGGDASGLLNDKQGPEIRLFLNDELFVNGGLTNQRPFLIVKLSDSSGINTTGTGIGHDLIATLDEDVNRYFILNDFYQADRNSYQQGSVRFQLPALEPGRHTIRLKAWDVLNNSNEALLEFIVGTDDDLELRHVLNYPNPFSTHTVFWFEHNRPGQPLRVQIQVMTMTGRTVKTMTKNLVTDGNRSAEMEWDGRDEFGDRLGRGVYLYRLRVTDSGGVRKEVLEKLVIL